MALTDLRAFITKYADDADWHELSTDAAEGSSAKCKDKWNILLSTHLNDVIESIVKTSCYQSQIFTVSHSTSLSIIITITIMLYYYNNSKTL